MSLRRLVNITFVLGAFSVPFSQSGIGSSWSVTFILALAVFFKEEGARFWEWKVWNHSAASASALLALYFTITLLWSDDSAHGFNNVKNLYHFLLIPVAAALLEKRYFKWAIILYYGGLFIHLVFSYLAYFKIYIFPHRPGQDLAIFMIRLDYVMILIIAIIGSIYGFFQYYKSKPLWAWALGGMGFFSLLLIFLMEARIGYLLAIVVVPLAFALLFSSLEKWKVLSFSLVAFCLAAYLAVALSPAVEKRLEQTKESIELLASGDNPKRYETSIGQRLMAINIGLAAFLENPILGVGAGDNVRTIQKGLRSYRKNENVKLRNVQVWNTHFHNQYIDFLVQGGVVGFVLFINVLVQFLRGRPKSGPWSNISILLVIAYAIGFLVEPYMQKQVPSAALFLVMALTLYRAKEDASGG